MKQNSSRVYKSERSDGRFMSTEGFVRDHIKRSTPKLAFDQDMSPHDIPLWRRQVKTRLYEMMSFPEFEEPQPAPKQMWSEDRVGYTLQKWEAYPEPGSVVPFLMLVPDEACPENTHRTVLCFPGSASSKEFLAGEPELDTGKVRDHFFEHNQMARHFAREGILAVAIDNPATCELKESGEEEDRDPNYNERVAMSATLINAGRSYLGLSVFQKTRILDWVRTLDIVDSDRIALSGHSLGTEPAMVMGILNEDIKALVFNDFLAYHRERFITSNRLDPFIEGLWHLVPGFWQWFDFPDLLAAFAPRPLIITEGGVTADLHLIKQAYETLGSADNFTFHYYDKYDGPEKSPHDFEEIPEGLSMEKYFEYANVDASHHYFKEDKAVPWLCRVL